MRLRHNGLVERHRVAIGGVDDYEPDASREHWEPNEDEILYTKDDKSLKDPNSNGTLFGGRVLDWIDEEAYIYCSYFNWIMIELLHVA